MSEDTQAGPNSYFMDSGMCRTPEGDLKEEIAVQECREKRDFLSGADQQQWQSWKNYETQILQDACGARGLQAKLVTPNLHLWQTCRTGSLRPIGSLSTTWDTWITA